MPQRDYVADLDRLLAIEMQGDDRPAPVLAGVIVAKLRSTDPELLAGWLDAQAEAIIAAVIRRKAHSKRSHLAATARGRAFRKAAIEHAKTGDDSVMAPFRNISFGTIFTVEHGERKPLRVLDHADLTYVADAYSQAATNNLVWSAFMQALARRVTTGTVEDHYTEQQILAMFGSIDRDVRGAA
jgi:hypothetical protein